MEALLSAVVAVVDLEGDPTAAGAVGSHRYSRPLLRTETDLTVVVAEVLTEAVVVETAVFLMAVVVVEVHSVAAALEEEAGRRR